MMNIPLRAATDTIFDDLGFFDRTNLFEELNQLFGAKTSSKLLDKYGSPVTLILSKLPFGCLAIGTFLRTRRPVTVLVTIAAFVIIPPGSPSRSVITFVFWRPRSTAMVIFVSLRPSSVVITTTASPSASVTAVSGAVVAFHVIVAVTVPIPSVFSAPISSLAVPLSITRPVAVFVSFTAFAAFATMAIILLGSRIFGIIGSGRIKESFDIES
jgi:hypothetical protein